MAKTGRGKEAHDHRGGKVKRLRDNRIAQYSGRLFFCRWIAYTYADAKKRAAAAVGLALLLASTAYALPQGGVVTSGSVSITRPNAQTMQINQHTDKAIINWQSYSIGGNQAVLYVQPGASSIALNRVTGLDPSLIYGQLAANGQVWVINPNGLLVGPNAKIDTGSFLASTLNISDQNFLSGNYVFTGAASSSVASIVNRGSIVVSNGGYVGLISPSVTNKGTIAANGGNVFLASGEEVTVTLAGNGLISLVVDRAAADGLGITNSGMIGADGGSVILTARTASDLLKNVVNNSGIIEAKSLVQQEGQIILDGGDAGIVANSGTLDVSSAQSGAKGGSIGIFGKYIGLLDNAKVNASGDTGGGTILIGGNLHGDGPQPNASMTYVGSDAAISADAIASGNGGKVVVWSNDATSFYGSIGAKGGARGGDGGYVEVSGKNYLDFAGLVNTLAPMGHTGTLLLDPTEITIEHGANGTDTRMTTSGPPFIDTSSGAGSILRDGTINTQLATSSVTVTTSSHDIAISNTAGTVAIAPTGGADTNSLTLNSAANISWNAPWSYANSGQLTLYAGGGTISGTGALAMGGSSPLLMQAVSRIGSSAASVTTTGITRLAATTGTGGIYIGNSGSDITIDALTNPVTGLSVSGLSATTSGNIQLGNSGSITTGLSTAINTTGSGSITLSGSAIGAPTNPITLSQGTGTVSLNTTGAGGNASIKGGALKFASSTIGGSLTAEATTGTITQTGPITTGAAGSSFTTDAANQAITLTNAGNGLTDAAFNTNGTANVSITNPALLFGTSIIGGSLTATATTGGITESGPITVGANGSTFTTSTAGQSIDLSTSTNVFNGKNVALNTTGAGGNASIKGGALKFASSTIGGSLTAEATTGTITQTGPITTGAAGSSFTTDAANQAITLTNAGNGLTDAAFNTNGTANVSITNPALLFGTSIIGGSLTATATTGDITGVRTDYVGANGSTFTTSTAGQSIDLSTSTNVFNGKNVSLNTTVRCGNASIKGGALKFASSTIGGSLTAEATTGTITQTGPITTGAAGSSFTTDAANQAITLTNAGNGLTDAAFNTNGTANVSITNPALLFGTSIIGGSLTATATTGGITESGPITVGANGSTFTTSTAGQSIDLSTSTNVFNGKNVALNTTGAGGNASIKGGALKFASSTIGGSLTAEATTGTITQTGPITTGAAGSSFTTDAANQAITLTNAGNGLTDAAFNTNGTANVSITNPALLFGTSIIGGSLTATATTGGITESGPITVGANGSTFTTSTAGQSIDLSTSTNVFNGKNVALNTTGAGGNASIKGGALKFASSTIGGSLTAEATTGTITQTGPITTGAAGSSFTTDAANQAITLTNAGNGLTDAAFNTNGTANVSITNPALLFGTSIIGGSLTATATTGGITESGPITVGANGSTFTTSTAGQSIDLSTSTNVFNGKNVALSTSGAGNASIKGGALKFASSTIGGSLTAEATTGTITQTGPITTGTLLLTNTSGATTLTDTGNAINALGTINAAGRTFTLTDNIATGLTQSGFMTARTLNVTNTAGATNLGTQANAITHLGTINTAGQTFSIQNGSSLGPDRHYYGEYGEHQHNGRPHPERRQHDRHLQRHELGLRQHQPHEHRRPAYHHGHQQHRRRERHRQQHRCPDYHGRNHHRCERRHQPHGNQRHGDNRRCGDCRRVWSSNPGGNGRDKRHPHQCQCGKQLREHKRRSRT